MNKIMNFLTWEQVKNKICLLSEYLNERDYLKEIDVFYYLKIDQSGL